MPGSTQRAMRGRRRPDDEGSEAMPRYEFKDGKSSKFWLISLHGDAYTTRFGKIGSEGKRASKYFGSPAGAQAAYDKLVAEKTKKGYVLVDPNANDDLYEEIRE